MGIPAIRYGYEASPTWERAYKQINACKQIKNNTDRNLPKDAARVAFCSCEEEQGTATHGGDRRSEFIERPDMMQSALTDAGEKRGRKRGKKPENKWKREREGGRDGGTDGGTDGRTEQQRTARTYKPTDQPRQQRPCLPALRTLGRRLIIPGAKR